MKKVFAAFDLSSFLIYKSYNDHIQPFFGVDNIQIIHFDAEADFVIVGT